MKKCTFNSLWLALVMLVMCSVVLSSCDSKSRVRREVKKSVEEVNRECPLEVPGLGLLTSMNYEDNYVVIKYKVNLPVKLSVLQEHQTLVKTNAVNGMLNGDNDKFVNQLIEAEVGIKMVMVGGVDNGRLELSISPEEIKRISSHPLSKAQMLDNQVESASMQLPLQVDEISTMVDVKNLSDRVQYVYEITDNNNEVEMMAAMEELVKNNIIKSFKLPAQAKFVQLLVDNNKPVEIYYVGTETGEEWSLVISVDELRNSQN